MEPVFSVILRQRRCTTLKISAFAATDFDEYASKDLFRVLVGRSWVGGKRQQATFFTYPEVMAMMERMSGEALELSLPPKIYPGNFPKSSRVRVSFTDPFKASELSFTRVTPFQDENKAWCTYVVGIKESVKLSNLEIVE